MPSDSDLDVTSARSSFETSHTGSSSSRPRTPVSEWLGFLPFSPRNSRSPSPGNDATAGTITAKITPSPGQMLKSSSVASTSKLRMPIIRWLGRDSSDYGNVKAKPEGVLDNGIMGISSPSLALQQAINEQLPNRPPPALTRPLPDSQHPFPTSPSFTGPLLMTSLARSTLPTYCQPCEADTTADIPVIVNQSPPSRTSLETLRSLSQRCIHTSASQSEPFTPSPTRSWFRWENKATVDRLLVEEDRAEPVKGEEENIHRKYQTPRDPIVFCHGLLGFDSIQLGASFAPVQVSHWKGIKEVLEANGAEVLITRVPATSSISDRARVLEQRVSEVYPGREVHLVGHSMGGLDCRYVAAHLRDSKFKVRSITTIATPHRGSTFADHFLHTIGRDRLPSVISLLDMLPNGGGDGKAFESLTVERMRRFNEETPDVDGVEYFSWGATYEPGLIDTWRWPHSVVLEREGPNDGLVSVESSKWGTYLGTLENVSHLDLVGWINTARYKWAELTGREIAFKPATFYLSIADHLARVVEGRGSQDRIENSTKSMNFAESCSAEASDVSYQSEATDRERRAPASEEGRTETTSNSKRRDDDITRTQ